jgi:hypothetical protein
MDCVEIKTNQITLNSTVSYFSNTLINTKITTDLHENIFLESGMQAIIKILIKCRNQNGAV